MLVTVEPKMACRAGSSPFVLVIASTCRPTREWNDCNAADFAWNHAGERVLELVVEQLVPTVATSGLTIELVAYLTIPAGTRPPHTLEGAHR